MLPDFTDRISLLEYVNQSFPNGIGVEVGSASGCFTKQILATWKSCEMLHCIDLWAHQESGYPDDCNLSDDVQKERYKRFLLDFKGVPNINVIKQWSHIASALFDDESVDFIYLDANHSTAGCMSDLVAWYPKLKNGGIISGHDYCPGNGEGYGVKDAVDGFAKENGLVVASTKNEFCRDSGVYGPCWEGFSFVIEK